MTAPALLAWRPSRRPEVELGPGLLRGPAPVHLVKDARTGSRYEIGPREYFVLSRLDGTRSLAEIGDAYVERFHRRLGDDSWGQLLGLYASKDLLVSAAGTPAAPPPVTVVQAPIKSGFLRGEKVWGQPARLIRKVLRYERVLFSAWLWVPLGAALIAMTVVIGRHLPELFTASKNMFDQPELAMLVFGLLWLSSGLHEVGHGLVCTRYGGGTGNVGIRWRAPMVFLYCEVEDVNLFRSRWQRIATASAGVIVNMVFLVPFFVLWELLPAGDVTRDAIGAMLILGCIRAFINLVPVAPLDGYLIVCHALNMVHLAPESDRYLKTRLLSLIGKADRPRGYPRFTPAVYVSYAVFQLVAKVAIVAGLAWYLVAEAPGVSGWVVVGILALLYVARFIGVRFRNRRAVPVNEGSEQ